MKRSFVQGVVVLGLLLLGALVEAAEPRTKNVLFVMLDGLRWQEVFGGPEESLLNLERGGVTNVPSIRERFWRETLDERRAALMPFLWNVVAQEGQLFGNQPDGSVARVTNDKHFSYPGYNEVLCGYADPLVTSNDKIPNRNRTVLEWLHEKPEFKGRIAAFTSWEVFPFIINTQRSGIPVNSGLMPIEGVESSPQIDLLNKLITQTTLDGETTRPDALTFHAALEYLKAKKPRVLFISFDETDAQGHAGRYDRVLASAHKNDAFLRELWETVQSMPEYRGTTSLVVTTDHGRGDPPEGWKNHSIKIPGSADIWIGVLGPDTPPLGVREKIEPVTQSQVAATLAALLGYDYHAAAPAAAPPLPGVTGKD